MLSPIRYVDSVHSKPAVTGTEMSRNFRRQSRTLDPYLATWELQKANVFFVTASLVNLNLPTDSARRAFSSKVDDLASVVRDLVARENYALDSRLHDEALMKGIVESEDEYVRVKRLAHRMRRIKEHATINGAWIIDDER
jgi:hypothetical protein